MTEELFDPGSRPGPSHRAPKVIYWLDIRTIGKLRHSTRGGGKYTSRDSALKQQAYLATKGIESVLYETGPLTWQETP